MQISFDELPVWLTHEEAGKLIPSRQLKALREGSKIRFRQIEGKLAYFLLDLLQAKGVSNLLFHADAPMEETTVEIEETVAPAKVEVVEVVKEAPKATEEGPVSYHYIFADLFTYPSNSLPENEPLPLIRLRKERGVFDYKQLVTGKLVDIQRFMAKRGTDIYPKVRFIIQSLTNPNHYMVLQTRYDKYHSGFFADVLGELLMKATNLRENLEIHLGTTDDDSLFYEVVVGAESQTYVNPNAYQTGVDPKTLEAKLDAALANLKDQGLQREVCDKAKDFNYQEYLEHMKEKKAALIKAKSDDNL
jgi:hypothetical protein